MSEYQIGFNNTTKVVTIQHKGDALPVGSNNIGYFKHDELTDPLGNNPSVPGNGVLGENHVFWHHVREALYHVNAETGLAVPGALQFPNNISGMDGITLVIDNDYVALTGITITPSTVTLTSEAPTAQLGITKAPTNASNGKVTWVSSDPTKATVSSTGLVTRVANGTTTITATSEDGAKVATRTVTVTA